MMTREDPAAAQPRAAWRGKHIAGVAAALAVLVCSAAAQAQTGGAPPIRIPPAQLPAAAIIRPAPRALLPMDVQTVRDPDGAGTAMSGTLAGKAASATGVVLSILANSGAFDPTPAAQFIVADQDDRHAQSLFTATVNGAPVIGIAVVALDETAGDVAVIYDDGAAFADSFPRLRRALARAGPAGAGDADNPPCECPAKPDGNADTGWSELIAAAAKGGEEPADDPLARSLADRLAGDTGHPWRIVPPAELR